MTPQYISLSTTQVGIAGILDSQIMILDEPTASLDKNRSEVFENELVSWVESSQDRAFIWVTHKKEQESKVGKSFLSLANGTLS